jgi:phenylacetic acid degradation operon negative regulatory protein
VPAVTTSNHIDDTTLQASSAMSVLNEVSAMPRTQSGRSPQHPLVTLFGDFWLGADELLPSAAIAEPMGEFGFSDSAARTALSRLARRGALAQSRDGRRTLST